MPVNDTLTPGQRFVDLSGLGSEVRGMAKKSKKSKKSKKKGKK
jgi:hypothetical protein